VYHLTCAMGSLHATWHAAHVARVLYSMHAATQDCNAPCTAIPCSHQRGALYAPPASTGSCPCHSASRHHCQPAACHKADQPYW
jgi:hypothetical protein